MSRAAAIYNRLFFHPKHETVYNVRMWDYMLSIDNGEIRMSDHGHGNTSGEHFSAFMSRERDRLRAEREQIFNQQEELKRKLDEINREFAAIEAYEISKDRQGGAGRQRPGGASTTSPPRQQTRGAAEI